MTLIRPAYNLRNPRGQIVRCAFKGVFPSIRVTVSVADAFRGAALAAFHAISGSKDSFLLSGHLAAGQVDAEHRHAHYLPKPDNEGRIRELLVVSPQERFSNSEVAALKAVTTLRWNGPSAKANLEVVDLDDQSEIKLSAHWVSLSPYVPPRRFWGTHGKHHLSPDKQIVAEIAAADRNIVVAEIKLRRWGALGIRIPSRSTTKLANTPSQRTAFQVAFKTETPVCGPIALGHSCYFGLGLFVPAANV